jgi:hypothetical protein
VLNLKTPFPEKIKYPNSSWTSNCHAVMIVTGLTLIGNSSRITIVKEKLKILQCKITTVKL